MPSKKKKYNARFPAGRIKKIMQSDEEIGKVAQAVPVIISRTLELFIESLLTKTLKVTHSRNAKTLSPSHMKQCIMSENRFDFLRELVKTIPDISVAEDFAGNESTSSGPPSDHEQPYDLSKPSTSTAGTGTKRNGSLKRMMGLQTVPEDLSIAGKGSVTEECQSELKRQWENVRRIRNEFEYNAAGSDATNNHNNSKDKHSSLPAKLKRTESTPTTSQSNTTNYVLPGTSKTNRRLQHQAKSLPGGSGCNVSASRTTARRQSNIITPAPIVSIDFRNKPVVKIDYSNLDLHDTKYSGSNTDPANSNSSPAAFNIDFSNIYTSQMSSGTSASIPSYSNNAAIRNDVGPPAPLAATSLLPNSQPSVELDEDYDNI